MNIVPIRDHPTGAGAAAPAVELDRVSKLYGEFAALRQVSLTLAAGSSTMLLGENGAGKSTLLKIVAGLAAPTPLPGRAHSGVTVLGGSPHEQRGRMAYMSHASMLYDELTGMENLTYFARLLGRETDRMALEARAAAALSEVGLEPGLKRRVGEYSQGMRQRTSLARALLARPELVLLDEPFSNLDIGSAHGMVDRLLAYLAEPGEDGAPRSLLLTTHQAELAKPLAKTTVTLCAGRVDSIVNAAGSGPRDAA